MCTYCIILSYSYEHLSVQCIRTCIWVSVYTSISISVSMSGLLLTTVVKIRTFISLYCCTYVLDMYTATSIYIATAISISIWNRKIFHVYDIYVQIHLKDACIGVAWRLHLRDMTSSHGWHGSFKFTFSPVCICMTWLLYICVWHDSFTCLTCPLRVVFWHDSFVSVAWLIHVRERGTNSKGRVCLAGVSLSTNLFCIFRSCFSKDVSGDGSQQKGQLEWNEKMPDIVWWDCKLRWREWVSIVSWHDAFYRLHSIMTWNHSITRSKRSRPSIKTSTHCSRSCLSVSYLFVCIRAEEIRLKIMNTAKISYKFSRESL